MRYTVVGFKTRLISADKAVRKRQIVADFIRARSGRQKEQRMAEIKHAADELFRERSYHEITLKAIAERLGWSHAALYKYVKTKEEIYLELCDDYCRSFYDSLLTAYPQGCTYSHEVLAEVWAEQLNSNREYLTYSNMLFTIIETNVSAERLAVFKKNYYECLDRLSNRFCTNLGMKPENADKLFHAVLFHAVNMNGWCTDNPLVTEAMQIAGLENRLPDFKDELREFIGMCLNHYCG